VFFGLKTEGVDVDTSLGDIGVVLVRLDKVEVLAEAFGETVVSVELEFRGFGAVDTIRIGVVEQVTGGEVSIRLDNPDKFFAWVVEVEFDLVGCAGDGFITCKLELFDKVFV
jgi:hypothetical protein